MYKRKLIASLIIVLVSFYKLDAQEKESTSVPAQNSEIDDLEQTGIPKGKVISISPHVGPVIDESEREKYNLFPDVIGFRTALFIEQPNGRMMLRIKYHDERTGEFRFNNIDISHKSVREMTAEINEIAAKESEKTNDPTQRKHVDIAERIICFSIGYGLPLIENGPQTFDGFTFGTIMISSPQFPVAFLFHGGYGSNQEKYETEGLSQPFSYSTNSLLYMRSITKSKKTNVFAGAGIGSIDLEEYGSGTDHLRITSRLYSLEIGFKTQTPFLGLFIEYKWLYAKEWRNCTQLTLGIDFNLYFGDREIDKEHQL